MHHESYAFIKTCVVVLFEFECSNVLLSGEDGVSRAILSLSLSNAMQLFKRTSTAFVVRARNKL